MIKLLQYICSAVIRFSNKVEFTRSYEFIILKDNPGKLLGFDFK